MCNVYACPQGRPDEGARLNRRIKSPFKKQFFVCILCFKLFSSMPLTYWVLGASCTSRIHILPLSSIKKCMSTDKAPTIHSCTSCYSYLSFVFRGKKCMSADKATHRSSPENISVYKEVMIWWSRSMKIKNRSWCKTITIIQNMLIADIFPYTKDLFLMRVLEHKLGFN